MKPSKISKLILDDREFLVKRDDLIDPFLAGNKYRKLYTLLKTPNSKYNRIISYGGTQSNAMLAIAAMCAKKGWEFNYYTKKLSTFQKQNSDGNYADAIKLGMKHIELENELYKEYIASLSVVQDEKTFIIHQGGAIDAAKEGIEVLAQEIVSQNLDTKALATPSGTGTTALFLAYFLPQFKVYTTPAIGDVEYLKTQMLSLIDPLPKNLIILKPKKKYHFAKPYRNFYNIYLKTIQAGIEFDLLYAPAMFEALLEQTDEKILYIHSGGVTGNKSMKQRYKRAFNF